MSEILRPGYDGGIYSLRYRTFSNHNTAAGLQSSQFDTDETTSTPIAGHTHVIRGLTLGRLYAIQLRYEKRETPPGTTETVVTQRVYAARDVYVWPSSAPAVDGRAVATFPLEERLVDTVVDSNTGKAHRAYEYRICEKTFPPGDFLDGRNKRVAWEKMIRHAFGQWELATAGLLRMVHVDEDCADYTTFIDDIVSVVENAIAEGHEVNVQVGTFLSNYQNRLRLSALRDEDSALNEVLMFDDVEGTTRAPHGCRSFP